MLLTTKQTTPCPRRRRLRRGRAVLAPCCCCRASTVYCTLRRPLGREDGVKLFSHQPTKTAHARGAPPLSVPASRRGRLDWPSWATPVTLVSLCAHAQLVSSDGAVCRYRVQSTEYLAPLSAPVTAANSARGPGGHPLFFFFLLYLPPLGIGLFPPRCRESGIRAPNKFHLCFSAAGV